MFDQFVLFVRHVFGVFGFLVVGFLGVSGSLVDIGNNLVTTLGIGTFCGCITSLDIDRFGILGIFGIWSIRINRGFRIGGVGISSGFLRVFGSLFSLSAA